MMITCTRCKARVPKDSAYYSVTGYSKFRDRGGANTVALRVPDYTKVICNGCKMELDKHGDMDQTKLF